MTFLSSRSRSKSALFLLSRVDPFDVDSARSRMDLVTEALEAVVDLAERAAEPAPCRALLARAHVDLVVGDIDGAATWCERALTAAARSGDREIEVIGRVALDLLDASVEPEPGETWADRVGAIVAATSNTRVLGLCEMALGASWAIRDQPSRAVSHLTTAAAKLRASGDHAHESLALARLANATADLGRIDDAARIASDALELAVRAEFAIGEAQARLVGARILQARGKFDDALRAFDAALVTARATGDRLTEAFVLALSGNLALERGRPDEALDRYTPAAARFEQVAQPAPRRAFSRTLVGRLSALCAARTAIALAKVGDHARAEAEWRRVGRFEAWSRLTPAARTVLELERSRLRLLLGRTPRAASLAHARLRDAERGNVTAASEDVRLSIRMLRRDLAAHNGGRDASAPIAPAGPTLVVGPGGAWFQIDEEPAVCLDRLAAPRRIVERLASERIERRGSPVPLPELFAAAWPGARIDWACARNRLHVALHKLRSLGLRDVLVCRDGGALFDPAVELTARSQPSPRTRRSRARRSG